MHRDVQSENIRRAVTSFEVSKSAAISSSSTFYFYSLLLKLSMASDFWENGYEIEKLNIRGSDVLNQVERVWGKVFTKLGLANCSATSPEFLKNLAFVFEHHNQTFLNVGKQLQHLWDLHELGVSSPIWCKLVSLGLHNISISTRPVLYFNHPLLAKEEYYWKTPPHQDWRSMQGSINSMVVWVPLTDVDKDLGTIEIVPGSHKLGLQSLEENQLVGSFGTVSGYKDEDFVSIPVKEGECVYFSSFLVHRSGTNSTNKIRWSCHFRYNSLDDETFLDRGYPHAYIYRPVDTLLTPDFDTAKAMEMMCQKRLKSHS